MTDTTPAWSRENFPYLKHDLIEAWRDDEVPDPAAIRDYRAYVAGVHRDVLTVDQRRLLNRVEADRTADNIARLIVRAGASRLKLLEFAVKAEVDEEGREVESKAVADLRAWLGRFWLVNQWERLQHETTFAALRDGNTALALAWRRRDDSGDVIVTRETWWDGEGGVFVARDTDGAELWAVKEFDDRDPADPLKHIRRRTVYYPDRIARYVRKGDGWEEFRTDTQPGIVPWLKADGSPLGLPIVHFPNGTTVTDSWYGQSELAGLLGFQDDLNAIQHDITAAAMFTGFQTLTATGVQTPEKLKRLPGGMLTSTNDAARFGAIEPGDMSQLAASHAYKRQAMAIVSSTPVHAIETQNLNNVPGVTLLRAEMPFIDKIEQLGSTLGPRYTQVAHRAVEIANAFGRAGLDEGIPITSVFAPAMRVDEETETRLAQAKADLWETIARLPRTAMLKTGLLTEDEADALLEEREAAGQAFARAFDAGRIEP